ncbi:hypothetical protein JIG36_44175 [Actinoplanes sp. LDG1-06]|uniref:Uncharacterized protein n=1 Tax=Paractinoplanes ovalisporus TaxID=2810368 RepID=A0ABS2ARN0_9ACTN|nr:hypothetical protein [Actinoplanes ovalisporus]MBM2622522.1 hypothetical protein [Actinoplanes ovalisporus]
MRGPPAPRCRAAVPAVPWEPELPPSPYADSFSDYLFTADWDTRLLAEGSAEFDYPLPERAIPALRRQLDELPSTYSWAGNQGCDRVYRFGGPARVLVAVAGDQVLYSVADDPRHADLSALDSPRRA